MRNSKLIYIIVFIAILIGIYGVVTKFSLSEEPIQITNDEGTFKSVSLWQLKNPIEKGSPITLNDIREVQLSEPDAKKLGVNDNVVLNIDLQSLANTSLEGGSYIFPEQISKPGDSGYLSLVSRDGMSLYLLTVATKNLIQDYILPGDLIDIMAVSSPEFNLALNNSKSGRQVADRFIGLESFLLMSKVRVISIVEASSDETDSENNEDKSEILSPKLKNINEEETRIIIEVNPDDLARLTLAQRTMYIEVYPSQTYTEIPEAVVSDIISNYTGIIELRGAQKANVGGIY